MSSPVGFHGSLPRGKAGAPVIALGAADAIADAGYMDHALRAAERAYVTGDLPVGAVATRGGVVIGVAWNEKESLPDPTAHAEMLLLRRVAHDLGRWRLPDVTIYCTLEPCAMCAGAMVQARLGRLVFAADDPRAGAAGSVFDLLGTTALNHQVPTTRGVGAEMATDLLRAFVRALRERPPRMRQVAPCAGK